MRLSVQIEFDKTLDLTTAKKTVVVGRSKDSDLVIPHTSISRQHCRIDFVKEAFFITDLGSANGVSINGKRLAPKLKTAIPAGAQLSIGGLECEVSDFIPKVAEDKVIDVSTQGDFTATIRLSRIDLNQPSLTLELEKQKAATMHLKGPRNPILERKIPDEDETFRGLVPFLIIVAVALIALAWYFGR